MQSVLGMQNEKNAVQRNGRNAVVAAGMLLAAAVLALGGRVAPVRAAGPATVPDCPFPPKEGRTIVDFGTDAATNGLIASIGPTQRDRNVSLPPGRYTISYYSYDGYEGREAEPAERQRQEQWNLLLYDAAGSLVARFGPTEDLRDGVAFADAQGTFAEGAALARKVVRVVAQHVLHPADPSKYPNSVHVRCIAFDRITTPPPVCPFTEADGVVVAFPNPSEKLRSDVSKEGARKRVELAESLPEGTYEVKLASFDDHSAQANPSQPREQWFLSLLAENGSEVASTSPTPDIPDAEDTVSVVVETSLAMSAPVRSLEAVHAAYPDTSSPNSVVPLCAALKRITQPQTPVCTMSITPAEVRAGEGTQVTLQWSALGVTSGTIQPDIGTVAATGSIAFVPTKTQEYIGTFSGPGGTVQCSAKVSVVAPPCAGCGGGYDQPRIELSAVTFREPPKEEPLGYVYLTQIPYTGVVMQPALALLVWLFLLGISFAIAYWLIRREGWRILARWLQPPAEPMSEPSASSREPAGGASQPPLASPVPGEEADHALSVDHPSMAANHPVPPSTDTASEQEDETLLRFLEEEAQNARVIISPEGLRKIIERAQEDPTKARQLLADVVEAAKKLYEPEDGWIPLNRDRIQALLLATIQMGTADEERLESGDGAASQRHNGGEGKSEPAQQEEREGGDALRSLILQAAKEQETVPLSAEAAILRALIRGREGRVLEVLRSSRDPVAVLLSLGNTIDTVLTAKRAQQPVASELEGIAQLLASIPQEAATRLVEVLLSVVDKPYSPAVAAKLVALQAIRELAAFRSSAIPQAGNK